MADSTSPRYNTSVNKCRSDFDKIEENEMDPQSFFRGVICKGVNGKCNAQCKCNADPDPTKFEQNR